MICPCGCGDKIELNLMKATRPCWTAEQHPDGLVTAATPWSTSRARRETIEAKKANWLQRTGAAQHRCAFSGQTPKCRAARNGPVSIQQTDLLHAPPLEGKDD